jgi:hypothetical protein
MIAIAAIAVVATAFTAVRPWLLRGSELPSRIVGKTLLMYELECPTPLPKGFAAIVEEFDGTSYRLRCSTPISVGVRSISILHVSARHRGYPLSSVRSRRGLAVNGKFDGGVEFIGFARLDRV